MSEFQSLDTLKVLLLFFVFLYTASYKQDYKLSSEQENLNVTLTVQGQLQLHRAGEIKELIFYPFDSTINWVATGFGYLTLIHLQFICT